MKILGCEILCIVLVSSGLFSQSVTGSFFFNGGNTSSNESYACYSIVGETFVGAGSNEAYHVFVGSQFSRDYIITGIDRFENSSLPDRYSLSQNYPNPFNPTTTIQFSIPSSSNVRISIYNALGSLVHLLVNGHYSPGRYIATWDASSLPSGMYFYRIQSGSYVDTKRLILLK